MTFCSAQSRAAQTCAGRQPFSSTWQRRIIVARGPSPRDVRPLDVVPRAVRRASWTAPSHVVVRNHARKHVRRRSAACTARMPGTALRKAPPCGDTGAVSAPPRGCTRTRCVGHSVCPQSRIACPPHGTRVGLECLAERGRSTHADVGGVHTPTQLTCAGLPAASAPDPYIKGFHYATFHVLVPGSFEMGCNFCGTQASWSSPLPLRSML